MTNEEAIKSLMRCEAETHCRHYAETFRCDGCNKRKALDMAIQALQDIEDGKYIELDEELENMLMV